VKREGEGGGGGGVALLSHARQRRFSLPRTRRGLGFCRSRLVLPCRSNISHLSVPRLLIKQRVVLSFPSLPLSYSSARRARARALIASSQRLNAAELELALKRRQPLVQQRRRLRRRVGRVRREIGVCVLCCCACVFCDRGEGGEGPGGGGGVSATVVLRGAGEDKRRMGCVEHK
jgi:hypothetical protein